MRDDMSKVIVERPRHGWRIRHRSRCSAWERAVRCRFGEDGVPSRMPMGFAATKGLNENLAPLRRFLVSRVGQSWDAVYSEIRTRLAPRNTIDMHVWQHLFDYVLFARPSRKGGIQLVRRTGEVLAEIAPADVGIYRAHGVVAGGLWSVLTESCIARAKSITRQLDESRAGAERVRGSQAFLSRTTKTGFAHAGQIKRSLCRMSFPASE